MRKSNLYFNRIGRDQISIAADFKTFFDNIAIDNADTISMRYGEVTRALNMAFRNTDARNSNNLQVGSYGRWTAIKGISDLDMLYIMPEWTWDDYKDGGQAKLLRHAANAIKSRYPRTEVYPDTLVVVVEYANFKIEVQPVFNDSHGHYLYPYARGVGGWRTTKPRPELDATASLNRDTNGNLRRLAKMARAWKNKHGVQMGGLLIDTLAHNYLRTTDQFDKTSFGACGNMIAGFLEFLADQPDQDRYAALGSGQHVKVKKKFQKKARKGADIALRALEAGEGAAANNLWRALLGRAFPYGARSILLEKSYTAASGPMRTEEFIEDMFPVDIRYSLRLECEVTQDGFRAFLMRAARRLGGVKYIKREKMLRFYIESHTIKRDFDVYWKVLNRGPEAFRRDMVRGQIERGDPSKIEHSSFRGEHVVDCFAVQNGVVVAKDRIHVPITDESEGGYG